MWTDPSVWIGGLAAAALFLVALIFAFRTWKRRIRQFAAMDGTEDETETGAAASRMEWSRYATYGLALLALIPANPAVFVLILRHPKLHGILSVGGIVFILAAAGKAIFKLDLAALFPTRPSYLSTLRNLGLGLCAGFVLLLCAQLLVDAELRQQVIGTWKTK